MGILGFRRATPEIVRIFGKAARIHYRQTLTSPKTGEPRTITLPLFGLFLLTGRGSVNGRTEVRLHCGSSFIENALGRGAPNLWKLPNHRREG